nr:EVE domain-containing protein [Kofleriaceae bacterium]
MKYWLMKTEPEEFSIAELARKRTEPWSGVRNLVARNHMRAMSLGDGVLFYHSSCSPPGVAGLARVCAVAHADATQFDRTSDYFDAKSTPDKPRWDCVDVEYVETLPSYVSLDDIRAEPALQDMVVLKFSRLSVQPVEPAEYKRIVAMGRRKPRASRAK